MNHQPEKSADPQDPQEGRRRIFAKAFMKRLKTVDKVVSSLRQNTGTEDDEPRRFVRCVECFKKRPLLKGMDPKSIPKVSFQNDWFDVLI